MYGFIYDADFVDRGKIASLYRQYNPESGAHVREVFAPKMRRATMGGIIDPDSHMLWYFLNLLANSNVVDLELEGCAFGDRGAQMVANALLLTQKLEKVNFSSTRITDIGAIKLLATLKRPESPIREFRMANNSLTPEISMAIVFALRANVLRVLDISGNRLGNLGMKSIYDNRSQFAGNFGMLAELNLASNGIGSDGAIEIAKLVEWNARAENNLRRLILRDNPLGNGVIAIMQVLPETQVTWLDVSYCSLQSGSAPSIAVALVGSTRLEGIDLQHNAFGEGMNVIAQALPSARVKTILLGGNLLSDTVFSNLMRGLQRNTSISKLGLSNAGITPVRFEWLSGVFRQNMRSKLTSLDLSGNNFRAFQPFIDALQTRNRVTTLNLSGIHNRIGIPVLLRAIANGTLPVDELDIDDTDCDEDAVQILATVFRNDNFLHKLSMRRNAISDIGAMARALIGNANLTELYLGHNPIGDDGAEIIASTLTEGCALTLLDISHCQITDAGMFDLANMIEYNTTLRTLFLSGNRSTGAEAREFESGLLRARARHGFISLQTIRGLNPADNESYATVRRLLEIGRLESN